MSYVSPDWDAKLEDFTERQRAYFSAMTQQQFGLINPDPFTQKYTADSQLRSERAKMLSEFDWDRRFDQTYLKWFFDRWPYPSKYLSLGE